MVNLGQGKIDFFSETYDDIRIVPGAFQFAGAADPSLSAWQPTGTGASFLIYEFNNADVVYFIVQMPHNYKQGTDLLAHVHWTPRARGVTENTHTVFWKLDYSIANIDANFGASATVDMTDTCDGVNEKHLLSPELTISGTNLTVSHIITCRLYRDAGDTWATNTANNRPALLEFDFHYQLDSTGSQTSLTKTNKNA